MTARIIAENGALAFYTPYDPDLLVDFKAAIPAANRRWDSGRKCWLVAGSELLRLEEVCDRYGLAVIKQLTALYDVPRTIRKIVRISYIGAPKEREDGSISAMANVDGDWTVVFPQDVLRDWFELGIPAAPQTMLTYYATLNVRPAAAPDEIKTAYRKMAKRWHPDVNRDPDATSMFKRIGQAYEVLSDPQKRRRYDAGLALEAGLAVKKKGDLFSDSFFTWRPPVRCGLVLVEGQERLGRLNVSKILMWQPIVNAIGQELVTSWPMGADTWLETWI